jgi:Dihydroorotase and related cyclic amidohydrolases
MVCIQKARGSSPLSSTGQRPNAIFGALPPFLCYSGCLGSLGEDALGAATTIVNAKVFDGTKSQDWTSVRFADGLITRCSAASAAQEGDEVIDAGGGTVLPGLIDAHVHLVPGALAQSLTFGVTTVLDMFSKPDLVASAKEQAGSRPDVADVRLGCRCHRARRAPVDDVRPVPDVDRR